MDIDQTQFNYSPTLGLAVAVMVYRMLQIWTVQQA